MESVGRLIRPGRGPAGRPRRPRLQRHAGESALAGRFHLPGDMKRLCLCGCVIEAFARRIVGREMSLRTDVVLDALEEPLADR